MKKFFLQLKIKKIDYVLLVFVVLAAAVLLLFLFRKTEVIRIRVRVVEPRSLYTATLSDPAANPKSWYSNVFKVGAVERDALGRVTTKVVGMEIVPITNENRIVYLDLETKAVYDSRTQTYSLKGSQLTYGSPVRFALSDVIFEGIVTDVGENKKLYEEGHVTVKAKLLWSSREFSDTYGVLSYIAQAVKKGDAVKDSNGLVLAEVLAVENIAAKRTVLDASGSPRVVIDPVLRDVTYTIRLRTKKVKNDTYIFEDIPLLIDQVVPLNLPMISLQPNITEILE